MPNFTFEGPVVLDKNCDESISVRQSMVRVLGFYELIIITECLKLNVHKCKKGRAILHSNNKLCVHELTKV